MGRINFSSGDLYGDIAFDEDAILEQIANDYTPGDVFNEEALTEWAKYNDFIDKKETNSYSKAQWKCPLCGEENTIQVTSTNVVEKFKTSCKSCNYSFKGTIITPQPIVVPEG